ncbi:MAG: phage holin family protein [Burkholderiaceae bacterium]
MAREIRNRWRSRLLAPLFGALREGSVAWNSRWELARLEWAIERGRLMQSLAGLVILAVAALLVLAFAGFALVVTWWDTEHRTMVAWLVVGAYAVLALIGLCMWRFAELRKDRRFAALRSELAADREWLGRRLRRPTRSQPHG